LAPWSSYCGLAKSLSCRLTFEAVFLSGLLPGLPSKTFTHSGFGLGPLPPIETSRENVPKYTVACVSSDGPHISPKVPEISSCPSPVLVQQAARIGFREGSRLYGLTQAFNRASAFAIADTQAHP